MNIHLLNDQDLKDLQKDQENFQKMLIIDIREPDEYVREHIPGSINIPLNQLDEKNFSDQKETPVIFYCKLGSRTSMAKQTLINTGFKNIYCLKDGIEQWKRCGNQIKKNKKYPLEIMRQVQIVAGILIIIGVILSYLISPWFNMLSAFVGMGLLLAGISGFCGMAKLLKFFPWNQ